MRFNGGANAGHSIRSGDQEFNAHLLPAGIVRPNTVSVIGRGVVWSPPGLLREMDDAEDAGLPVTEGGFLISDICCKIPIDLISTGPERSQLIVR